MQQHILLITPPFTQLNTPYPATAYLKGFLNTKNIASEQLDLGIETILKIFSSSGLKGIFDIDLLMATEFSANARRIFNLRTSYIETIDSVIAFLQNRDDTLAHLICERNFLPEASKFLQTEDFDWAFGSMGIRDRARHIATLYLEDLSDFIVEAIDPHFGFSRYAERLAMSARSFDEIYAQLAQPINFVLSTMLDILQETIEKSQPELVCISLPFPGNVVAGFVCGQWIKKHHPHIPVALGGGYVNTELRSLSDIRVFEFIDFITLDNGETPILNLLSYLNGDIEKSMLKRALMVEDEKVVYFDGSLQPDIKQEQVGVPDYDGLPLDKYLSVIQLTNPMHRLWSDGRWNKLTMAHGCYWGKCTFCDISLDYIKNYEANSASTIVDRMSHLIAQTGERGFHFVDEAAPPALMKAIALEILRRKIVVTWWANIRFEKSFNLDLCRLLSASGCIAVSGGLEVASDRLLKLIDKGVTIEQVARVNENFNLAGIMVHAYLMYGFPTQTDQETVDSLEVVRQMFEVGVMQSAFWHRFAMTAHSPVGMFPDKFNVENLDKTIGSFANNDLMHDDPSGGNHDLFSAGLKKSLYNYMHGICLDHPLQNWFTHQIPKTTIASNLIASFLEKPDRQAAKDNHIMIWIGGHVTFDDHHQRLIIDTRQIQYEVACSEAIGIWLSLTLLHVSEKDSFPLTFKEFRTSYIQTIGEDFTLFWYGRIMEELKEIGLLVL